VSQSLDRFHFNGAVAKIRELTNALEQINAAASDEAAALTYGLEIVAQLLAPMLPHIAEEMWAKLGHTTPLIHTSWPKADPVYLIDNTVTIAVQVNGKLRATITLPRDVAAKDAEAAALSDPNVQRAMNGNAVKKVIVIPNKIINVVA
jgi:leucyl-tRNA synthetase